MIPINKIFFTLNCWLLLAFFIKLQGQCLGVPVGSFPGIVDGITVTQTYTGDIQISTSYTYCGISAGPTFIGGSVLVGSPFTQNLTFSNPINNIIYILTASDSDSYACETFTFNVNSGVLTCMQDSSSCSYTQLGNVFRANSNLSFNGHGNAAYITLTSTIPYTSITVSGTGGANGSFMALCSSSSTNLNNNNFDAHFKIYPTPINENLKIYNLQFTVYSLQFTDILGHVIERRELKDKEETIDVSNLSNGVYLVSIKTPEGAITKKVILQH